MMDKSGRLQKNFSSRKINLPSPDQVTPFLEITMQLLDAAVTVFHSVSQTYIDHYIVSIKCAVGNVV